MMLVVSRRMSMRPAISCMMCMELKARPPPAWHQKGLAAMRGKTRCSREVLEAIAVLDHLSLWIEPVAGIRV